MVRIYTFAVNRPEFLFYQRKMFDRFLQDEHQLIVINDGHDEGQGGIPDGNRQIGDMARSLNLPSYTVTDPRRDTANYGHARAIEFAYEHFIRDDKDVSVLLDGDMFPGKPFSIREYLDGHAMAGLEQSRGHVYYLWPGLVFLDMARLPDRDALSFWPDAVDGVGCDVGGHSYEYLQRHPDVKVKWMDYASPITAENGNLQTLPPDIRAVYDDAFAVEILLGSFIHYRGGTNWDWRSAEHHERKTRFLCDMLDRLASGTSVLL